ncbi:MAG: hypothetical protein R6W90_15465 [Ignavibacteriaceae bacterium]
MKHYAVPSFWESYEHLPLKIQKLADQCYTILKLNPLHPSLHFKKIGNYRSVRIGSNYRALAIEHPDGLLWFWIGNHDEYQRMIKR